MYSEFLLLLIECAPATLAIVSALAKMAESAAEVHNAVGSNIKTEESSFLGAVELKLEDQVAAMGIPAANVRLTFLALRGTGMLATALATVRRANRGKKPLPPPEPIANSGSTTPVPPNNAKGEKK